MDYEKAYKEALERARQSLTYPDMPGFMRVDVIFPELRESEDEKIRKALINGVECCKASGWTNFGNNVDIDVVLAWLEKQGEQKPTESPKDYHSIDPHFGISVEDLITKKNTNDKVEPRYNIGDVLCDKSCTTLDKNSQPNIEILDIRDDMYICNNCTFPISQQDEYELVAKRIEPQTVWSEEDEKTFEEYIEDAFNAGMQEMREQMMKDATDVTVHIEAGNYPYIPQMELYDYDKDIPLAKEGDKYKVVLIKED